MYSFEEVKFLLCKKLDKKFVEFGVRDTAILTVVSLDCQCGRYSKFLMWDLDRIKAFFKYLNRKGISYFELSDVERWAIEDAFDM